MSLSLYYAPGACSFVPHVLLELAGAEFWQDTDGLVDVHRQ